MKRICTLIVLLAISSARLRKVTGTSTVQTMFCTVLVTLHSCSLLDVTLHSCSMLDVTLHSCSLLDVTLHYCSLLDATIEMLRLLQWHASRGVTFSNYAPELHGTTPLHRMASHPCTVWRHTPTLYVLPETVGPALLSTKPTAIQLRSKTKCVRLDGVQTIHVYAILIFLATGTVRVFRQKFTLEDAIGSHACSLQANMRVTNGISLGRPPFYRLTLCNFLPNTEGTQACAALATS
jgi:hypothetical protein